MLKKRRFPWIAVSAIVAVVGVATLGGLRLPDGTGKPEVASALPKLELGLIESPLSKELLAEQLAAYDPAPLFIPSPMNTSEAILPDESRLGAGAPFGAIAPVLTKSGPTHFPSPQPIPGGPMDGLSLTERLDTPLFLARNDLENDPLINRLGYVQVFTVDGGRVVLEKELPVSSGLPEADWQPLELLGAVTRTGLLGELVVTTSSGSEEIDEYFRANLKKTERMGARLAEGFYVFRVGP